VKREVNISIMHSWHSPNGKVNKIFLGIRICSERSVQLFSWLSVGWIYEESIFHVKFRFDFSLFRCPRKINYGLPVAYTLARTF